MARMIELVRRSALPSHTMQAAARGALAVPPAEMIEILVHLAKHNKVFGQQARLTLAGWDEASSLAAASDPNTPQEVLDYLISPQNLRPRLLPALLENPSVSQAALVEHAATASREVVEAMLKSPRVKGSATIMNALASNPNFPGTDTAATGATPESLEKEDATSGDAGATPAGDQVAPDHGIEGPAEPEHVLAEEVFEAYLAEHATEIASQGDKPFQPIGGLLDELAAEEPALPAPPPAPVASAAPAAAAAQAKRAPVVKKTFLTHEEARGSALQKISKLDIKGRIQLSLKGTKEERSILIRDGTKLVALAVLESPKITDGEVERFASQKNVLEAVLRGIPMKRRFAKQYSILRNLVFNPRTPLDVSLGLMKNMLRHDLKNLSSNKEVSDTVRKLALKMFRQKLQTTGKSGE